MNGQMKGKRFADVSEVKKKAMEVLNINNTEEFQICLQQWEKRLYSTSVIDSKVECFEGD